MLANTYKSKAVLSTILGFLFIFTVLAAPISQTYAQETGANAPPGQPTGSGDTQAVNASIPEGRGGIGDGFSGVVYNMVTTVFGTLLRLAGQGLDSVLDNFVVGFGDWFVDEGVGGAVNNLWAVVRDIFNLAFIFGLVYIGFRFIFDSTNTQARRTLVTLVIAALLVNFSLFFTKFVVDFTNLLATQIYGLFQDSVATSFMNVMNIASIIDINTGAMQSTTTVGSWSYIFGILIIFLVSAFVFAAGAILLIIRFAVLNIYMILSPLMFTGFVFPKLWNTTVDYVRGFFAQALFAPVYLLLLYFSYSILVNVQNYLRNDQPSPINYANAFTENEGYTIIPYFILSCVFLIASILVAQKLGTVGGAGAVNAGKRVRTRTRNAFTAAPRYAARAGVGATSRRFEKSFKRWEAKPKDQQSTIGRGVRSVVRGTNLDRTILETTDKGKKIKAGFRRSSQENIDYNKEQQRRLNQKQAEIGRENQFEKAINTLDNEQASEDNLIAALDNLGATVRKMTTEEKKELGAEKLANQRTAIHLSDNDISELEKTGAFSNAQIQDIKANRDEGFKAIASGTTNAKNTNAGDTLYNTQRAKLMQRSVQDIGQMPPEVFAEPKMASYLTPQMLEQRMRNGKIDNEQLNKITENIQDHINKPDTSDKVANMWSQWGQRSVYGAQAGF